MEPQEQSVSPNSSIADVLAIPGTNKHSQEVLKKFNRAIKQVANEQGTNNEASLTQEELIQLVRTWEPQRDIVCLYVRWSRQLRRNFNLDSIATLLCLSRQCGYTPLDFLRKVKTLSILKNQKASYGVTFNFDIPNRRDINREQLNKEFLGLSVTLALLQEQVTELPSVLGKTKMRQSGPRKAHAIDLHVVGEDKQPASIVTQPNVEFHTQSSLLNRIWLSIKHRWVALYITEHLFREANQPSWSFQEGLIFSFQMMAPCGPSRYDFLSPLVGYCLRYPTQESIDAKRVRLREIWKDPSSFLSYGDMCLTQFSSDTRVRVITACFHDLSSDIPSTSKQISYHRDCSWLRRWNILRAYIFHFWLDSVSNSDLKSTIIKGSPTTTACALKKKKKSPPDKTIAFASVNSDSSKSVQAEVQVENSRTRSKRFKSGLHSITSSRRTPTATAPRTSNHEKPPDVYDSTADGKIGKSKTTSHLPAHNEDDGPTKTLFHDTDWTGLRLITSAELESIVQSYLLIHRHDGVDVLSGLSPLEVYSADNLHDLSHCRLSGPSPFFPKTKLAPVYLHVSPDADQFIDTTGKSFHVAREHSSHFVEHSHHLPSMHQIQQLCNAIVRHGKVDSKRAIGQHRVNIGNGGQNWIDGAPCQLHGLQFEKELDKDRDFDATEVLQSIGRLVEFTWHVTCSMQNDTSDHPIAPDKVRRKLYAESLDTYLNMDEEVGFEDLTLVVSSLHPVAHEVSEHKDSMNDTLAGYTRTAAFNLVLIGDDNDDQPTVIHLQVICNFRKVIGCFVVPFHSSLSNVAKHSRQYLQKWQRNVQSIFGGKTNTIPTPYDRTPFFLDDCLEFSTIAISEAGRHKQAISSEYILTEINISRTMSLSMFIDPLVKMQRLLKFDQTIELALACSFLSNPFWFDWTMSSLMQRLDNPEGTFRLELHPFYDWSRTTIEIFGAWQGGPYNRWSPCGGSKESVLETFGAQPNASSEERHRGERKLSQVVSILLDHVEWINSLTGCGDRPVVDMPLSSMKERCDRTVNDISQVASCQFSHFRLGILTTILSGCGLLKAGKHLRNCMYPVKGSASYKHLSRPTADCMSREKASALGDNVRNEAISNDGQGCVQEQHHDLFMQYLSVNLGFKVYVRDEIECILCESHPMRSLNCRDWFRKGMSLYDCNENGEFFSREYGRNTSWVKMNPPEEYEFAYLGTTSIQYIPIDARLSYYAANFGEDLRANSCKKVRFKGRSSRTSSHQRLFSSTYQPTRETFCHPSMQMADFYIGSQAKKNRLKAMFVLGDGEHAVEVNNCNDLYKFQSGKILHEYLQTLLLSNDQQETTVMAAGCYHMDSELTNHVTAFFPGHLDKPFVHTVWFVPLGSTAFFTVISVPATCMLIQDQDSLTYFNEWKDRLSTNERQIVNEFLRDFDHQAKVHMKQDLVKRVIYLNKRGSVLSFPANQCYHATITPKKPIGFPRDMLIFHPLDGISGTVNGCRVSWLLLSR